MTATATTIAIKQCEKMSEKMTEDICKETRETREISGRNSREGRGL